MSSAGTKTYRQLMLGSAAFCMLFCIVLKFSSSAQEGHYPLFVAGPVQNSKPNLSGIASTAFDGVLNYNPLNPYRGNEQQRTIWGGVPVFDSNGKGNRYFELKIKYYALRADYIHQAAAWEEWAENAADKNIRILLYSRACRLYLLTGKYDRYTSSLKQIADLRLQMGLYEESKADLLRIIKFQQSYGSKEIMFSYDLLAAVYEKQKIYDQALQYSLRSIKAAYKYKKLADLVSFYNRTAGIYASTGNTQKVIEYGMKTYNANNAYSAREPRSEFDEFFNYYTLKFVNKYYYMEGNTGEPLRLLRESENRHPPKTDVGRFFYNFALGDYCAFVKKYHRAEQYYLIASGLSDKRDDAGGRLNIDLNLCSIYSIEGNYVKLRSTLTDFFKKLVPDFSKAGLARAYYYRFELDSVSGNWKSATLNFKIQDSLTSSMLSGAQQSRLNELEVHQKTSDREDEISRLRAEDKIRSGIMRSEDRSRRSAYTIIGLLLVISLLLFYNDDIKRAANRLIKKQKSEIDSQHTRLKSELGQKEILVEDRQWLLRELQHRVGENLETIKNLLNIHIEHLGDGAAITAINDTLHRISSIALIHKKLDHSGSSASADMSLFIAELTQYLAGSLSAGKKISFELQLSPIVMEISYAVPLGIIINEVVTNAIKYAFRAFGEGLIFISLSSGKDGQCELFISDNGEGMEKGLDLWNSNTMGMTLIQTFCEQIEAECTVENNKGVSYRISFPLQHPEK